MSDNTNTLLLAAINLHQSGNLIDAEKIYLDVLKDNPDNANALNLLGNLLIQKKQFEKAILNLKKASDLYPTFFDALFNLALAYKKSNQFDNAIKTYEKALELKPNDVAIHFNLGNLYEDINETLTAIKHYEKAFEYNTDYNDTDIPYFLGICYIKAKNFERGLKLHEYRPSKPFAKLCQAREYKDIDTKPEWDGKPMKDKTIFVYYESAFGDTLMYVRYLELLRDKFAKVLFKPQISFIDFFKENNFGAEIIESRTLPENVRFDTHIPLMSIPYALKMFDENIPLAEGYLKANLQKVQQYKEQYFNNDKFKVGIKWMGNPGNDITRIITVESFYKLFEMSNTQFYSVQKGDGVEEFERIPKQYGVIDLGDTFNDFGDTAAAIENMDLVICNDTSVAHIAAAMGKPCWILLPFVQNWRWHIDISYSPWYKSAKLFKQNEPGNWDEVFEMVKTELSRLIL